MISELNIFNRIAAQRFTQRSAKVAIDLGFMPMNQGYSRLVAKYKQDKSDKYWDANLDRIQSKRNNQMRDAINKAARFIVNRCLSDGIGHLVIGWNEGQKICSNMGKQNNQNFVPIPTGRLIQRLKQLCSEYGIIMTVTEESYTSKASFLDDDFLPLYGEKPDQWKPSGERVKRGLYKTAKSLLINADCNGAANIIRKVATQLAVTLTKVGSGRQDSSHNDTIYSVTAVDLIVSVA